MGKKKRNSQARQVVQTVIDERATRKISVTFSNVRDEKYDESNALVLPSKKRKVTKIFANKQSQVKKLTKKQRKRLEKFAEKKKKKANRKKLLEDLAKVQASKEELALMVSTASMQTKGLKRYTTEQKFPQTIPQTSSTSLRSLRGSRKRKFYDSYEKLEEDNNNSSDEDDDGDEEEEEEEEEKKEEEEYEEDNKKIVIEDKELKVVFSNKELDPQEVRDQDSDSEVIRNKKEKSNNKSKEFPSKKKKSSGKNNKKQKTPSSSDIDKKPSIHVPVHRIPEVQESRLKLPILAEEQVIMEAINSNFVIVLCGETGSGKTTQVPQFLYEAGYARNKMIGITEPRRVAAVSMSKRVGYEMNLSTDEVSYQIRFEGNTTENTKIKFMTDGVLLKEIQSDFLLTNYSVVVIDEAHERSVYTDILIGLLSRIAPLRFKRGDPLKLIIMSATLRVEDFTENTRLFPHPPCFIQVNSRQFPVTIHFNKHTKEDYVTEAYRKVCKIHSTLPSGGILVFVTGQQEVNSLCHKLRKRYPRTATNIGDDKGKEEKSINVNPDNDDDGNDDFFKKKNKKIKKKKKKRIQDLSSVPKINLDDYTELPLHDDDENDSVGDISDMDDLNVDDDEEDITSKVHSCSEPLHVLPLYSLLPSDRQAKVFQSPPEGSRLCVVATNVAETSITIPNVKYVVDTGKVKTKVYDKVTGVSAFIITWISKAAADQRAGRAGRTGPGHCYRLYSSAVFNDEFAKYSKPEICRKPIDDLVLQMKDLNIERVVNFPFPSPPDIETIKAAESRLRLLGALEEINKNQPLKQLKSAEWSSKITSLGHAMACFPVAPGYAKMLAISHQHDLLPFVICIVSALTVQEVMIEGNQSAMEGDSVSDVNSWKQTRRKWAGEGNSLLLGDPMILLKAIGAAEFAGCTPFFCAENGLRYKAIKEIRKLRQQLTSSINLVLPNVNLCLDPKMQPPSDLQSKLLRQIVLAGLPHHVARKIPENEIKEDEDKKKYKRAYQCTEVEELVFIHQNSVLHKEQPAFIAYQEIFETSKLYMRGITAIEPEWLPVFAPTMCTFSKPLDEPKPSYDQRKDQITCFMKTTFGPHNWPLPVIEMEYPDGLEKFKWFAVYFLEGEIFPRLQNFRKILLSTPSTMLKSWAKLQLRTQTFLNALIEQNVSSKKAIEKVWEEDKNYLLEEYQEWIPESTHIMVAAVWPPT